MSTSTSRFASPAARSLLLAAGLVAMAALAGAACSDSDPTPAPTDAQSGKDAGKDAGGSPDGPAAETTPPVDAAAEAGFETGGPGASNPMVCLDIRNCVVRCLGDAACAQRCADVAPAVARMAYQAVATCSQQACAVDDRSCRCNRECLEPGECVALVDECRAGGGEDDTFCDEMCH